MTSGIKFFTICLFATGAISFTACKNSAKTAEKQKHDEVMQNKENRVSPPATAANTISGNTVTINYGSPRVKGRVIWGDLVPYNEVWRTGANEATTVEFTKDVLLEGESLKKGTYGFFTIPNPDEWTIIFNLDEKQWGAFKYDESQDELRVMVMPKKISPQERLVYKINKHGFSMDWDTVSIPVSVK